MSRFAAAITALPFHAFWLCSCRVHPAPTTSEEFSKIMEHESARNESLLAYAYPSEPLPDVQRNWVPYTASCRIANDCYCIHVDGDMSASVNPKPTRCVKKITLERCSGSALRAGCSCLTGSSCLFSDMRPTKILSAVTAARVAGITRIFEEGRYGGLSALMYALHGFEVISLELAPLSGPSVSIRQLAPQIQLITGDGSVLLPQLLANSSAADAARTMVIFDGEKRFDAYRTYEKIRKHIALAIFDDTNIDSRHGFMEHSSFNEMLHQKGEVWWWTNDTRYAHFRAREGVPIERLTAELHANATRRFLGGIHMLERFHFTIVRAGAWAPHRNSSSRSFDS